MGVLNVTPDSFSDGGLYLSPQKAVKRVRKMIKEGADIIDIGGESTRLGAKLVTLEKELNRVIPVIKKIKEKFGDKILVSVDTYKSEVARQALSLGVNIVNAFGGFSLDPKLTQIVAKFNCPVIIYHKGEIKNNAVAEIKTFFQNQIKFGVSKGIKKDKFWIDPGIGFDKTVGQNLEIIKRLKEFTSLGLPIVVGISRKTHLGKILQEELKLSTLPSPTERLEASLAETAVGVLGGANMVRTHDILQTKKFLVVLDRLKYA